MWLDEWIVKIVILLDDRDIHFVNDSDRNLSVKNVFIESNYWTLRIFNDRIICLYCYSSFALSIPHFLPLKQSYMTIYMYRLLVLYLFFFSFHLVWIAVFVFFLFSHCCYLFSFYIYDDVRCIFPSFSVMCPKSATFRLFSELSIGYNCYRWTSNFTENVRKIYNLSMNDNLRRWSNRVTTENADKNHQHHGHF